MSGLAAPARTATPRPTRRSPWSGRPRTWPGRRLLEQLLRHDAGVERGAAGGLLDQLGRGAELKREFMSGGALELRAELAHRSRNAAACQDRELSSLHIDHRQWNERQS